MSMRILFLIFFILISASLSFGETIRLKNRTRPNDYFAQEQVLFQSESIPGISESRDGLPGNYRITYALNPDRAGYQGIVNIAKRRDVYRLAWEIPPGSPSYEGIGIVLDNTLCVGWARGGYYGVVVYKVQDGKLTGRWTTANSAAIGTEELEGPAGLSGVYKIVNSFSPQTGRGYAGTVSINKTDQVYLVNWNLTSESYSGVGILHNDLLIVGWGIGESIGVVFYEITNKELLGHWAIPQSTGVGIENLSK